MGNAILCLTLLSLLSPLHATASAVIYCSEAVLFPCWIALWAGAVSPAAAGCATSGGSPLPVSLSALCECGQLSWAITTANLRRNSILKFVMLLSCFIRHCRIRVQCVVVSDLSAFLPRSPVTLKWVGLKVLCRPLLYCISLKVGKCPGSEWCGFGTCSDIWLCWDGGGLAFGSDPAFPVLQSSCWLLTDFSLLNLKTKQTNRTNKKQQKAQQTWNILVDSGLKLTFKTSGGFPNALFCLSHCLVAHRLDPCVFPELFLCSAARTTQVISVWADISGQSLLWSFQ